MKRFLQAAALVLVSAGCVRRPVMLAPGDAEVGVQVTWHGHACFTIEDSVGRKMFIDPFDETVGYRLVWDDPQAVLITDDHFDRNGLRRAGRYDVVAATGVTTASGIEVTGVDADHDAQGGAISGGTRIYVWEMGGVRFADLGGIGQTSLRPDQKAALKNIDVLFVPVGGHVVTDAAAAAALTREIAPRVVVPMQYGTDRLRGFVLDPVEPFLDEFDEVVDLPDNRFQVRRDALPEAMTVYVPAMPEE
jgi:L-ascorbate metabolism protein UlaG (beta-lactamase superfamily)